MEFRKIKYNKDKIELKYEANGDEYKLSSTLSGDPVKAIKNLIDEATLYLEGKRSQMSILDEIEINVN